MLHTVILAPFFEYFQEDQTVHVAVDDDQFDYIEASNSTDIEDCPATIDICQKVLERLEAIKQYGEKIPDIANRELHAVVLNSFNNIWQLFPTEEEIVEAASDLTSAASLELIVEKMSNVSRR